MQAFTLKQNSCIDPGLREVGKAFQRRQGLKRRPILRRHGLDARRAACATCEVSMNRRRLRLIRPKMQFRLILCFLGITALGLELQYLLFVRVLADAATNAGPAGAGLLDLIGARLLIVLGVSFMLLLPVTLFVGVLVTHRLVGPIHRFEMYLKELLEGRSARECHLRKGDELLDLCDLINRATKPLRAQIEMEQEARAEVTRREEAA